MSNKVYEIVTDRIVKLLESKQELVWQRGWQDNSQRPMNGKSLTAYRGFNRMLLTVLGESPYWLTFNQIKSKRGSLKKGSKSVPIIFWNWVYFDSEGRKVKDASKAAKKIPFLRYYNVFNAADIEGIEFPEIKKIELKDNQKIDKCEAIITSHTDLKIKHEGSKAFYRPSTDSVTMPPMETFNNSECYYSVLFHEVAHWTGHSKRLNRELDTKLAPFGSTDYSQEELVAEMTASFLCEETQIANEQLNLNSAAYLKGWLSKLKDDTKMIIQAGAKAQKAADYILKV